MVRLMRAFPELVAMLHGLHEAATAVGSALALMVILIYVFSIMLYMRLKDSMLSDKRKAPTPTLTVSKNLFTQLF